MKKKSIICSVILLLIFCCVFVYSLPYFKPIEISSHGVHYKVYGKHAVVCGYTGDDKKVVIQSSVLGRKVKYINTDSFRDSSMEKIIIPDTVEVIETRAFVNCDNLLDVQMGNGITTIESLAFDNSNKSVMRSIHLPENLEYLGESNFDYVTAIWVPKSVKYVGGNSLGNYDSEDYMLHMEAEDAYICYRNFSDSYIEQSEEDFVVVAKTLVGYNGVDKIISVPDTVKYVDTIFPEGSIIYIPDTVCILNLCNVLREDNITIYIPASVTDVLYYTIPERGNNLLYVVKGSEAEQLAAQYGWNYEVVDEIIYPE